MAYSYQPLNGDPVTANNFSDTGLERGATYIYSVRSVVRLPTGGYVESGTSNEVEGKLKDGE